MVKINRFGSVLPALFAVLLSISLIGCVIVRQPSNNGVITTAIGDKSSAENVVGDKNSEVDIRKEFGVTNYQLTPKELESLMLIKKIKTFAREKLGFKLMWNYTKFNEGVKLTSIFYHRKDGLFPFSQLDQERVVVLNKRFGKDEASEKKWLTDKKHITEKEYDIWMYYPDGIASSEFVTPTFLKTEHFRMAEVIIHEIWHVQVRLPLHFEESTAVFIGRAGASIFWHDSEDKAHERLQTWLKFAEAINSCHAQISDLAIQLRDGKINLNEYLLERENCIKVANKSQTRVDNLTPMMVVHYHTYTHYFPLIYRLYDAMDRDLIKLIQALREINEHNEFQDPVERDPKIWFQKVRGAENKIEVYVENLIQKVITDKKERK